MTRLTRIILFGSALVQVGLGLAIWHGAFGLVSLHMAIGFVFVAALWTTAALSFRHDRARAIALLLIGVAVPVVGIAQRQWMIGAHHWVVQLFHLVLGLAAVGVARGAREPMSRASPG